MNIFLTDEELEEVKPVPESIDKGIVITSNTGKRGEENSEIQKELAAIDSLNAGASESAKIHGIAQSSASKYKDGKDISNEEVKARILSTKYNIQDVAVTKLMSALNVIEPSSNMKIRDQVAILNGLNNLVDKITDKGKEGLKSVHLHMYMPNQKKEEDYGEVIDAN